MSPAPAAPPEFRDRMQQALGTSVTSAGMLADLLWRAALDVLGDTEQWATFTGSEHPDDAAQTHWFDGDDAENAAREHVQWLRDGRLARRTITYGPWEVVNTERGERATTEAAEYVRKHRARLARRGAYAEAAFSAANRAEEYDPHLAHLACSAMTDAWSLCAVLRYLADEVSVDVALHAAEIAESMSANGDIFEHCTDVAPSETPTLLPRTKDGAS